MGKHFGNLQRLYGVTYYALSPNELRPFGGFLMPGIVNQARKMLEPDKFIFLFVALMSYTTIAMGIDYQNKSKRKDPLDYICDV